MKPHLQDREGIKWSADTFSAAEIAKSSVASPAVAGVSYQSMSGARETGSRPISNGRST